MQKVPACAWVETAETNEADSMYQKMNLHFAT